MGDVDYNAGQPKYTGALLKASDGTEAWEDAEDDEKDGDDFYLMGNYGAAITAYNKAKAHYAQAESDFWGSYDDALEAWDLFYEAEQHYLND